MTDQTWEEFMHDIERLEKSFLMKLIKVAFGFLYIAMFSAWFIAMLMVSV